MYYTMSTKTLVGAYENLNSSIKARCNSVIKKKSEHHYFPLKS